MHESQQLFLRLRELIARQQQMAQENGGQPYFSPAPNGEAEQGPMTPEQELEQQTMLLHERLLQEADMSDSLSQTYELSAQGLLDKLTAQRCISNDALDRITASLDDIAASRQLLRRVELDRYRLFARRDADSQDEEASMEVPEKLPGYAFAQRQAALAEVNALDQLVVALASETA